MLLCLSAHDKITLGRVIADIAAVASDYYAIDLAHTLNLHRTTFAQRAFTVLREGQGIAAFDPTVLRSGAATAKKAPGVAFLFTGQGVSLSLPALAQPLKKACTDQVTVGSVDWHGPCGHVGIPCVR